MKYSENTRHHQQRTISVAVLLLLCLSIVTSSIYRGIAHDEGLGGYREGGERIFTGQPVFDPQQGIGDAKAPARFMYMLFIALGYKIFGINLFALHVFPYLFQILTPLLLFWLAYRLYHNIWLGLAGTVFFLLNPVSMVFLGQQYNASIFVFFMLLLALLFDISVQKPRWLLLFGVVAALLLLTRFEGGVIFVSALYGAYLLQRWRNGIPIYWILASIGMFSATYVLCAWYFGFPVNYLMYYLPSALQRQEAYDSGMSFMQLTSLAIRHFMNWFFGGKIATLFIVPLLCLGIVVHIRKRIWYPLAIFAPYFLFLLFVYNGRGDILRLAVAPFVVPGFALIVLQGIEWLHIQAQRHKPGFHKLVVPGIAVIIIGVYLRTAPILMTMSDDVLPASTMWNIMRANSPLPGNPAYSEPFLTLSPTEQFPVRLREALFKDVRGRYRAWFLSEVGKYAVEQGLLERTLADADFAYRDDYESPEQWEKDRVALEGSSPLWNNKYEGRIGAFPFGKDGSFMYTFDFPQPIDHVTISDIHIQWGPGDMTNMWTSTDGKNWTLRYENPGARFKKDYYYQFFDEEFDGATSLFIKFYFKAGDKTRTGNDNRGACLEEFFLAVTYKE